jgi:hypothetical protein
MRFDHETFNNVASVKVNETKPMIVDTMDNGENAVWDTVMPILQSVSLERCEADCAA